MSASLLIWVTRWEVILFVGGLAITIALKLLTGDINTHYLLYGTRNDGTKYLSPERNHISPPQIETKSPDGTYPELTFNVG